MRKMILTSLICSMAVISFGQSKFDYAAAWKNVDNLSNDRGLPESALKEVDKIYEIAIKEKAYPNQIKAIKYKVQLMPQVSDDSNKSMVNWLTAELDKLEIPTKSVAQQMLANIYLQHFHQNRWQLFNSTSSVELEEDDFLTWSAEKLMDEIVENYRASLNNKNELLKYSTEDYSEIMRDKMTSDYMPSLYDVLMSDAIKALSNNDLSIHKPIDEFKIKEEHFELDKFLVMELSPVDETSNKYQTLKMYQEWLKSAKDRGDNKILVNTELTRLRYLNSKINKPELYEKEIKRLAENYKSEAHDVLYELAAIYYSRAQNFRETGKDRDGFLKAYEICEKIKKEYTDASAVLSSKTLIREIEKQRIGVTMENTISAFTPIKYKIDYSNVKNINVSVYKIGLRNYLDYRGHNRENPNYKKGEKVYDGNIDLLIKADHQKYSTELALSGLDFGFYSIVLSVDGELAYKNFQVTNLATIKTEKQNNLEVRDRISGEKLEGVKVSLYKKINKSPLISYVTDKEGMIYVKDDMREWFNHLIVQKGKDQLVASEYISGMQSYDQEYSFVKLFTDRAIYRPGQTVYFKGLSIQKDKEKQEIITNYEYRIDFFDANHQKISSLDVKTNEFGSFNGSFTIPQGLLNGRMQILANPIGGKVQLRSGNGSIEIRVEEYKRPKFEVKIETPETEIALNSNVVLNANAKALAGYAVDGAKGKFRVVRKSIFPYRFWFPILSADKEVANGSIETDEKGNFTIPFITEEGDDKNELVIYNYHVTADVTDLNGETRSATYILRASKKPLLIKSSIPSLIDLYSKDAELSYKLTTESLNEKEIESDFEIQIVELNAPEGIFRKSLWAAPDTFLMTQKEFENIFPLDDYDGSYTNTEKYSEGKVMATITQNSSKKNKVDLSALRNGSKEWYRIKIKAKSKQGLIVETKQDLRLMSLNVPISNMDNWLQTVKTEGKVNENAVFLLSGYDEGLVYYSVYDKYGKVAKKGKVEVSRNPKELILPITKSDVGGFRIDFSMIHHNRLYNKTEFVTVPWENKKLDIIFNTFRDKLKPGSDEKWSLTIKDEKGDAVLAEMVASLYDASLDSFVPHVWNTVNELYSQNHNYGHMSSNNMGLIGSVNNISYYIDTKYVRRYYPSLNMPYMPQLYGMLGGGLNAVMVRGSASSRKASAPAPPSPQMESFLDAEQAPMDMKVQEEVAVNENIDIRTNFNETAFFYPELRTNEKGEVIIEFTIPEALTRWKMLGFAHTKDLKIGSTTNELVTQKEIAITANAPRFFREGDKIEFTAKINNITEASLKANTYIQLYNAVNMQPINNLIKSKNKQDITVEAEQSTTVSWVIEIPKGVDAITYRVYADAGKHNDGEEKTIPVLANRMMVTETMPFMLRPNETKDLTFDKLYNTKSKTLDNYSLTLEFTSNPAWYAVQSLPYLMEYPYECTEQTFARFFSNTLGATIVEKNPSIKRIFNLWRNLPDSKALLSNLEKNQELKQVLLEETPWVRNAKDETEQKKRISLLFDLNQLGNETKRTIKVLQKAQNYDGGFPWFKDKSDRYVTQHLVTGFAKLKKLDAILPQYSSDIDAIARKAINYLDNQYQKEYSKLKKEKDIDLTKKHTNSIHLHYLYSVLYYNHIPRTEAYKYHYNQAMEYWSTFGIYEQGLIALIAQKTDKNIVAENIVKSLREKAIKSEDLGMYWKSNRGYFWYQAPIETHALMIEVFNDVAKDQKAVDELKLWLLLNKQTTHWQSTRATTEAVYALLFTGTDIVSETKPLEVAIGGKNLKDLKPDLKVEPGTGYAKTTWTDFNKNMANIKVENPNKGPAFGGVYWQYYEQLDKITSAETNIKIKRDLFIKRITDKGAVLIPLNKETAKVGDIITVRMELRADRDFEYVHLKDARASNLEPVSTISQYKYKNGLGYYENIKDASTNFFISYLRKGTYVFEYDLRVTHKGNFSNGISTFQCMYAPEFSAHSQGIRIDVK